MPRSTTRSNPPPGPRHVGLPLAGQPICSSSDALAVVSLAIQRPLVAETIAFLLDEASTSNTITAVIPATSGLISTSADTAAHPIDENASAKVAIRDEV